MDNERYERGVQKFKEIKGEKGEEAIARLKEQSWLAT